MGHIAFALKIHEKLIFFVVAQLFLVVFAFVLLQLNKNYLHALAI